MLDEKDLQAIAALIDRKINPINNILESQQTEIAKINLTLENRVEALEDEVAFLKQMIKTLASEVNSLKKAQ